MSISAGDRCPIFTLPNQHGDKVSIEKFIGKKNLVIYFYPKDETPGCTAEACSFRDSYTEFQELGCEVIGISSDSIRDHKKFAENHRLPFILLADTFKEVRKQFGVPGKLFGLIPGRVTYIVNKAGIVVSVHDAMVDAEGHIKNALKVVKELK